MEAAVVDRKAKTELVNFDKKGNIVVNKRDEKSAKLVARRAIEAHLDRKKMQLDDYWDDLED
jgi:putative aminopeptidase FrvX